VASESAQSGGLLVSGLYVIYNVRVIIGQIFSHTIVNQRMELFNLVIREATRSTLGVVTRRTPIVHISYHMCNIHVNCRSIEVSSADQQIGGEIGLGK
jgi:hypothetical protein